MSTTDLPGLDVRRSRTLYVPGLAGCSGQESNLHDDSETAVVDSCPEPCDEVRGGYVVTVTLRGEAADADRRCPSAIPGYEPRST